jgi:hypothetical protein
MWTRSTAQTTRWDQHLEPKWLRNLSISFKLSIKSLQFYNLENLSGAQIYIYAIASHFLVCCKTIAVEEVILVCSVTIMSKKWCYRAASERKLRVCRSQPRVHSIEVRKQSGIIIFVSVPQHPMYVDLHDVDSNQNRDRNNVKFTHRHADIFSSPWFFWPCNRRAMLLTTRFL